MGLEIQGKVVRGQGQLENFADGATPTVGMDQFSAALVSEVSPRYYNLVSAGLVFGVAYAQAALAAPSATGTGSFGFWNTTNSNKNVVLLDAAIGLIPSTAVASGCAVGIVTFSSQVPSSVTGGNAAQNCLTGSGNASQIKTFTAATIVGGQTIPIRNIATLYGDLAASDVVGVKDQIDGELIFPPGTGFGIAGYGGTPADVTITLSLTWAEIPV